MTDNTVCNLGNIKGEKGDKGEKGEKGDKGADGKDGKDGRGIAKTELVNGELVITYTDGTSDKFKITNDSTYSEEADGLIFELLSNGTYGVRVGTAANNTEISIPKTFNNKDVTVILENGFANCQNLVTISIPDSIIEIRDSGFKNCINLTDVELPANLESIGKFAFNKCKSLSNITIPPTTEFIGGFAFFQSSLSEATFEDTEGWIAGIDKFSVYYVGANSAGSLRLRAEAYNVFDNPKQTALCLTSGVSTRSGYKCWYTQDWVNIYRTK